jgi:hypothetical protein
MSKIGADFLLLRLRALLIRLLHCSRRFLTNLREGKRFTLPDSILGLNL